MGPAHDASSHGGLLLFSMRSVISAHCDGSATPLTANLPNFRRFLLP
jgi:hypothetical protein